MNRKRFLRTLGGAALLPLVDVSAAADACRVSPSVPEGPFYFDPKLIRQDITEGLAGAPMEYRISVVDASCRPIRNAAVDIWQCDADGVYSGYVDHVTNADTRGKTFLRGIQPTGADGMARFTSIYPGWYPRRITHVHVKIHNAGKVVLTTNLFYPDAVSAEVHSSGPYKAHGLNPLTATQDVELKGDSARLRALTMNVTREGGRYVGTYTFGVEA